MSGTELEIGAQACADSLVGSSIGLLENVAIIG